MKWSALLVGGLALLYLVGMNVFLGTRLFRDVVSADPDTLLVDYTSAYSLWPGSVHVEGLSIRGRDSNVEWILRLDRCDLHVALADLAHKKFHADHVRDDGLSMRVRRRVDSVTPQTMSALPPVPGFLDPPLADVGPPPPPLTDATYNLWSIELDDVVADHVREVWVDTVRYSGDMGIRGRWVFRPLRWLDVGPATVEVHSLDVSFGMIEPWASGIVGRLVVTIHPFDLQTVRGASIVDEVSIRGDLSGTAHVATVVNRAADGQGVQVSHAEAPFELRAEIGHGVLLPGTHLRTEPFDAGGKAAGLVFEASLQTDFLVDDLHVGYADVRVHAVRVSAGGRERARADFVAATLATRDLDLATHTFSEPAYAVEVEHAETDSLPYWCTRLPVPSALRVTSGSVTAGGRLEGAARERTGRGHVTVAARDLAVASGSARIQGGARGIFRLDGSLADERVDLSRSEVSLSDVRAVVKGVTVDARSVVARAPSLVLRKGGLTGRVAVDAPRIDVPSLSAVGALIPLPKDIAVENGSASARVRLDVDVTRFTADGDVALAARNLRLRLGAERLDGELTVTLSARRSGTATVLTGSRVAFKGSGAPGTLDWWGQATLREATLGVRPDLRFRASVSAASRDGSPLTALVADNTALPRWLLDAVSTKGLEATGELVVTPSLLALRSVEAHAQGADVGFELGKIRRAKREWAMLVDLGAALVGVDVDDGHTQVMLFGARPWFHEKVASLEALERRAE